jgi:subtilisin family serine protease
VERFSSWGPSRAGVVKPDVAGPNGLTVDGYGTRGFFGTSASAPAVAGTAAVVLSRWPDRNPVTIGTQLRAWAVNPGAVSPGRGSDARWGAGKVRLPGADSRALGCAGGGGGDAALMPWWLIAVRRRRR